LKTRTALLLIDVINDLDFPAGRRLLKYALPAARRIGSLKRRAQTAGIPIIYVNDNFGRWRSDFRRQVAHCLREGCLGRELARLLAPDDEDYFVLKPKHSGFYSTTLDLLLQSLKVNTVVLTGFASDICVLYTANDAYMRDYRIVVASDGVAAEQPSWNANALAQLRRLGADVRAARSIRFS
jgi:nicotinamidase-related amidase